MLVLACVMLALAACGSSQASTTAAATSIPPSAPAASTPAVAVSHETAETICNNLDAVFITQGPSGLTGQVSLAETMYDVTQAQVIAAVSADCPDLSKYMP